MCGGVDDGVGVVDSRELPSGTSGGGRGGGGGGGGGGGCRGGGGGAFSVSDLPQSVPQNMLHATAINKRSILVILVNASTDSY